MVYNAVSGGSRVMVRGVVKSDLTAPSYLHTRDAGKRVENSTAAVNVLNGLITATGVSTYQRTTRSLTGATTVTSEAKIANVSLFDGAITADAIETKATATINAAGDKLTRTGGTKFVNLHVRDNDLPVTVGKNTTVTIPGLAKVVLNEVKGQMGGDALIKSIATGIRVTLLTSSHGLDSGASIEITPTLAKIVLPVPIDGVPLFGGATAVRGKIQVGDAVKLRVGPVAAMVMPPGGTNGIKINNSVAKVRVPGLVTAFAAEGGAQGTVTSAESEGRMTGRVSDISLLDGAIVANALTGTAYLDVSDGNAPTVRGSSELLGLTINGKHYPVSVPPNTVVEIPHLVKVIINEQTRTTFPFNGIGVRALRVIALPDAPDDIKGLDLEIGVAAIWINSN